MPAIRLGLALLLFFTMVAPAFASQRVALVLGNSAYQHAPHLPNPVHDASSVARALEELGFRVILATDLEQLETQAIIRDFSREVKGAEAALFYYAGHGLQVDGRNFLMPVDARLSEEVDLDFEAVNLSLVLRQMQRAQTGLVFLDACRDNPLAQSLARSMATRSGEIGRGLAPVESGLGTLIAYATQPGNVALDGSGEFSPFTSALLEHLREPGLEVRQLLTRVRRTVVEQTDGAQVPWDHSSLTGEFFFVPPAPPPEPAPAASPYGIPAIKDDQLFWASIKDSQNVREYEAYLAAFPEGVYSVLARIRIDALGSRPVVPTEQPPAAQPPAASSPDAMPADPSTAQVLPNGAGTGQDASPEVAAVEPRAAPPPGTSPQPAEAPPAGAEARKSVALDATVSLPPGPSSTAGGRLPEESALMASLQAELNRLGCNAGPVDGIWGKRSQRALDLASRKVRLDSSAPTAATLAALEKSRGACPITCRASEVLQGDKCVRKSCPQGQSLSAQGVCRTSRSEPPVTQQRDVRQREVTTHQAPNSQAPSELSIAATPALTPPVSTAEDQPAATSGSSDGQEGARLCKYRENLGPLNTNNACGGDAAAAMAGAETASSRDGVEAERARRCKFLQRNSHVGPVPGCEDY